MKQGQAEPVTLPEAVAVAPPAIELRHLRYFVALADAGSFTHAAERMFIAQPTLSQQIRRLEEIVGTQLLQRRHEGLQLTKAGTVLLDASRTVLSLVDHEVNRTRQAAGLGRQRLRVAVPPRLPDAFAVGAASALRSAAAAADVDLVWMEAPLDAEFSLIRQHRADAGLGWLTASPEALPSPLQTWVTRNAPKLQSLGVILAKPALTVEKGAVSLLATLGTIFALLVLFLLEGPKMGRGLLDLVSPGRAAYCRRVAGEINQSVTGYAFGNLLTSLIAGLVVFVTLTVLGVPLPAAVGAVGGAG